MESTDETALCCANFYEQPWVAEIMGDSFHPGGVDLSMRLFEQLSLPSGARVLDVACGIGTTAIEVCRRYEACVVGVDFSEANLGRARERAKSLGVDSEFDTAHASASELPFEDDSFDALICECAVSTFADKSRVASEFARVLRPGGQLAISDMVVEGPIPASLDAVVGPWACVQDALPASGYRELFEAAGLDSTLQVDETACLGQLISTLKRKLVLVGLGQVSGVMPGIGLDLRQMRGLLAEARGCVDEGTVQYWRMGFALGEPARADSPARRAATAKTTRCCDPSTGCC